MEYKLLKFFISFVTTVKSRPALIIWKTEMKIDMFANLLIKEYHGNHKIFKSWYDFGVFCLKIRDACVDFEPYFKVHSLVSIHSKSVILGQMANLDMIFLVMVSVYRFVKVWNSPQFPAEFQNGQWAPVMISFSSLVCRYFCIFVLITD